MARPIVTGRQAGFTYIVLLMWVALTGAALGAIAEVWSAAQRREREAELLFVGEQFQVALERYGASGRFPKRLEDLLGDEKSVPTRRYLRQIYIDPMTGTNRWGTVSLPDGQIVGVYSTSDEAPMKIAGFKEKNASFAKKQRYSEWVFRAVNAPGTVLPNTAVPPQKFGGGTFSR